MREISPHPPGTDSLASLVRGEEDAALTSAIIGGLADLGEGFRDFL
jgi:hypothetical protein